jgi:hypothetical protein
MSATASLLHCQSLKCWSVWALLSCSSRRLSREILTRPFSVWMVERERWPVLRAGSTPPTKWFFLYYITDLLNEYSKKYNWTCQTYVHQLRGTFIIVVANVRGTLHHLIARESCSTRPEYKLKIFWLVPLSQPQSEFLRKQAALYTDVQPGCKRITPIWFEFAYQPGVKKIQPLEVYNIYIYTSQGL